MNVVNLSFFYVMWFFAFLAAKEDLKEHKILDVITVPFAVLGIAAGFVNGEYISACLGILFVVWVFAMPDKIYGIGDADILLYAGLIGYYYISGILLVVVVTNLIAVILYFIAVNKMREHSVEKVNKKDEFGDEVEEYKPAIPYAPAVFIAMPIIQVLINTVWYPIVRGL